MKGISYRQSIPVSTPESLIEVKRPQPIATSW